VERHYLIIADISGYTDYLKGAELDHARDVMADLLETVLGAMGPTPRLSEVEGDALFVHVPEAEVDGSMLLDTLEHCYFAFRRRARAIAQATTCSCNACTAVRGLDLKFCVHAGEAARQRVAGRERLMGSDVILVHRLLKNTVAETFGLHAYIVFTTACLERLGLNPDVLKMMPHRETYERFGNIPVHVHDLHARWKRWEETHRVFVRPEEADVDMRFSVPAPPALAWEYLTAPQKRHRWLAGVTSAHQEHGTSAARSAPSSTACTASTLIQRKSWTGDRSSPTRGARRYPESEKAP
jgi:hypothetical protein